MKSLEQFFPQLLKKQKPIWIQGVQDALSAQIAERVGFEAVAVQSLQVACVNGVPDTGVVSPSDMLEVVRRVRRAVDLPILVDFEQGFGDVYSAVFWMHEFERAGAAAVHIDDYGTPYKCPFTPPYVPELETPERTAEKIRAMAGEKLDQDFMIFARPGTYAARIDADDKTKRKDWYSRARTYKEAGADAIFVVVPTLDHAKSVRAEMNGPLLIQRNLGVSTPGSSALSYNDTLVNATVDDVFKIGYQIMLESTTTVGVAAKAMFDALQLERKARSMKVLKDKHGSLYELLDSWMGTSDVERIRRKYAGDSFSSSKKS